MPSIFYFIRRMRSPRGFVLCACVMVMAVGSAFSQTLVGTIAGTITDKAGSPIAGVRVEARDVDRNTIFTTNTDATGKYNLLRVPVGHYKVTALKSGFEKAIYSTFSLTLGQTAEINILMKIGHIQEIVSCPVGGMSPMLQTDSAELNTTIDSHAIDSLPL